MKKLFGLFLSATLLLSGCSVIVGEPLSESAKRTVSRVAVSYLNTVVYGAETKLADFIAWSEFLGRGNEKISHGEFSRMLALYKQKYPPTEPGNPLIGLKLDGISGGGDEAKVSFTKADGSSDEEIWVRLIWSGSGWIVSEDSLFGRDKLFGRLFPNPDPNRAS